MTAATYSSLAPLQGKRIWHAEAIDRLLPLWPAVAVATGAAGLWLFGLAIGAAITFGLLAGCAVALAWTFATVPLARVRDGLTSYTVETRPEPAQPPAPRPRAPILVAHHDVIYMVAAFYR